MLEVALDYRAVEPRPPSESHSELTRWMGIPDGQHGRQRARRDDHEAVRRGGRHRGRSATPGRRRGDGRDGPDDVPAPGASSASWSRCGRRVNAAWRTSMEVGVRVEKENVWTRRAAAHTSTAYLTLVALGRRREARRDVPPVDARSPTTRSAAPARPSCAATTACAERDQITARAAAGLSARHTATSGSPRRRVWTGDGAHRGGSWSDRRGGRRGPRDGRVVTRTTSRGPPRAKPNVVADHDRRPDGRATCRSCRARAG